MKKFKVIEESRFLNKQNLKQIVGGKCIGDTNFTICEPGAQLAGGFSTNFGGVLVILDGIIKVQVHVSIIL